MSSQGGERVDDVVECAPGFHSLDYVPGPGFWTSCIACGKQWASEPLGGVVPGRDGGLPEEGHSQ